MSVENKNYNFILESLKSNCQKETPIEKAIQEIFAPSLWGNDLVDRKSLHGRVSSWIYGLFPAAYLEKTHALVKEAYLHLEEIGELSCDTILHRKLHLFSKPASFEKPIPIENPENVENYRKAWIEKSFIPEKRQKKTVISIQGIQQWLSASIPSSSEIWELLKEFSPSSSKTTDLLASSLKQMAEFKQQFLRDSDRCNDPLDNLDSIARKALGKISQLKEGEKWLLCGSFGSTPLSSLATLPEMVKKKIPKDIFDILESLSPQAPEKFAAAQIKNKLIQMAANSPKLAQFLNDPRTHYIFTKESRVISQDLYDSLPPIYGNALNTISKNGVLYYIFRLLPQNSITEFLEWVNMHSQELAQYSNNDIMDKLEGEMAKLIQPVARGAFEIAGQTTKSLAKVLTTLLPAQLIEVMGLDPFLCSGNLWIEFERNGFGSFNVKIYGSEHALRYHKQDEHGNTIWPLVYENVPGYMLSTEFVSELLSYSLEPLINGEKIATPKAFYQDSLSKLKPYHVSSQRVIPPEATLDDFWGYAFAVLGNENKQPAQESKQSESRYQMTKEMLLCYLESIQTPKGLELNPNAFNIIESLLSRMASEANCILGFPQSELQKIQGTFYWLQFEKKQYEITHAADKKQKVSKFILPQPLLLQIREILKGFGITPKNFNKSKSLVTKALGDSISHLFDLFEEDLKKLPEEKDNTLLAQNNGWFQDQLQMLYSYLAFKVYRLALGLVETTEITTVTYTQALHITLVNSLPPSLRKWYCDAIEYIESSLKKLALNFIFWAFTQTLSDSIINDLTNVHNEWKATFQAILSYADPTAAKLSFKIEGELPISQIHWTKPESETLNLFPNNQLNTIARKKPDLNTSFPIYRSFPAKAEDLQKYLEDVISSLNNVWVYEARAYNAMQLLHLFPIPCHGKSTIWDEVENKALILEYVSEIASLAAEYGDQSSHATLTQYIALAVVDKLARYCDPLLEGFPIYTVHLFYYYSNNARLPSLRHYKIVDQLCAYFMPDVKPKKLSKDPYKSKAIKNYTKNSLFIYEPGGLMHSVGHTKEAEYYKKLINNRPLDSLFPSKTLRRFRPRNIAEAIVLLENESLVLNEKFPSPIPRAFSLLKRQVWAAHYYRSGDKSIIPKYAKTGTEWFYQHRLPSEKRPIANDWSYLPYTFPSQFPGGVNRHKWDLHESHGLHSSTKTTQSVLMSGLGPSPSEWKIMRYDESAMVISDKDTFIRHLEYVERYQIEEKWNLDAYHNYSYAAFTPSVKHLSYEVVEKGHSIISKNIDLFSKKLSPNALWWIYHGIRLQDMTPAFPFADRLHSRNYRAKLYALLKADPKHFTDAWRLIVFTFPANPEEMSFEEQKECAFAIAMAQFFPPPIAFDTLEYDFRTGRWKEILKQFLSNQNFRDSLGNALVALFTDIENPKLSFKSCILPLDFYNGTYSISVNHGTISLTQTKSYKESTILTHMKEYSEGKEFHKDDNNIYVSDDGKSGFYRVDDSDFFHKLVHIQDAPTDEWYLKCANDKLPAQIAAFTGYDSAPLWVEATDNPTAHVYSKEVSFVIDVKKNQLLKVLHKGQTLVPVKFSEVRAQLRAIERFAASSSIQCWADEQTGLLKYIILDEPKCLITIETEKGISRASLVHNGTKYFIDNSHFSILNAMPRHLVLVDANGNKFALIQSDQWLPALTARAFEPLQLRDETTHYFFGVAAATQDDTKKLEHTYYLYTIAQDETTAKDYLNCRDPKALAYLLSLFSLQGKTKEAEKVADEILLLSRQMPLPSSMLDMLFPLIFHQESSSRGVVSLPLKLLAAFAKNRLTHFSRDANEEPNWMTWLFFIAAAMKDTFTNGLSLQERGLTEAQEWYLYRFISHSLVKMIDQNRDLAGIFNYFSPESIIQILNLKPELSARIETLNKKFKIKESLLVQGAKHFHAIDSIKRNNLKQSVRKSIGHVKENGNLFERGQRFIADANSKITQFRSQIVDVSSQIVDRRLPNPVVDLTHQLPNQDVRNNNPSESFLSSFITKAAECYHLDKRKLEDLWMKMASAIRQKPDLTREGFRKNLAPFFLDYYGIVRNQTNKLPALKKLLRKNKNGWSNESRLLIYTLNVVCRKPGRFLPVKDLQLSLEKDQLDCALTNEKEALKEKLYGIFEGFFQDVFRSQYQEAGWQTLKSFIFNKTLEALNSAADSYRLRRLANPAPTNSGGSFFGFGLLTHLISYSSSAITAMNTGKAVYDYLTMEKPQETSTAIVSKDPKLQIDLSLLDTFDNNFQNSLRAIYDFVFTEIPFNNPNEKRFPAFPVDPNTPADDRVKLDIANTSNDDYHKRVGRVPNNDQLKGIDGLWKGFTYFIAFKEETENQCKKLKRAIKALLNPQELAHFPSISLNDVRQAVLDDNFKIIDAKLGIETRQQIIKKMFLCDAILSRLNQLEKVRNYFNGALDALDAKNGMEFGKQTQSLGIELKVQRTYKFEAFPSRLSYRFLNYERLNKQMLWESQVRAFSKQLLTNEQHMLSELMPSLGKTALGLGLQKSYLANGELVPVTSVPKQLADTNFKFVSRQCASIYGLNDTILEVSSAQGRTAESYQGLYVHLVDALENPASISMVKESSQALELEFFTKCLQMHSKKSFLNPEKELGDTIEALKNILIFKKERCILLGDEWHYQARQNKELIKPVGKKVHLELDIVRVIAKTLKHLTYCSNFHKKIQANELYQIDEEAYKAMAESVAKQMGCDPRYHIKEEQQEEFIRYLTDKFSPIPDFIEKHLLWKEISTIRGLLSVVIENVMKQDINVDYGIVTENHIEKAKEEDGTAPKKMPLNACPFEGNNAPLIGYSLQSPYEDFVKSYFAHFFNGLTPDACKPILKLLVELGKKQEETYKKSFEKTFAYKTFKSICPDLKLHKNEAYSPEELEKIYQAFKHNRIAIYLHIKYFVSQDIFYWERYTRSNATNYVAMYHSSKVQTGTPYNTGVYYPGTKIFYDEGTIGEILHLISNKCPQNGISVIPNQTPFKALETILKMYFSKGKSFSMIVDGAPFFKGITNIDVANRMATFCIDNDLPKKAIVFFHKDQLVYMDINTHELRPFSECKLDPSEYLTYLDDPHGFGSNVPQSGSAINTAGNQPFFKILQESFRLRELKKIITLLLEGDIKKFCEEFSQIVLQEIHFVMMQETCDKIAPKTANEPTIDELFRHNIEVEKEENKPANYEAYLQHLHNVVRRSIVDKILAAPDLDTLLDMVITYQDFLMPPTVIDPTRLFGWTLKDKKTTKAIGLVKKSLLNVIRNTKYFIKDEVKDEVADVKKLMDEIPVPPVPKKVRIAIKGDKVDTSVNEQLNKDVCVSQESTVDIENENCQELATQLETQKEKALDNDHNYVSETHEDKWHMSYPPRSLEWKSAKPTDFINMKIKEGFMKLASKSYNIFFGESEDPQNGAEALPRKVHFTNIRIYSFTDVCASAGSGAVKSISSFFDERLWITENFLPLERSTDAQPFGLKHDSVYKVLLHIEERNGIPHVVSAGCLTQEEADSWRKFLATPKTEQDPYKVVLYDLYTHGKDMGDNVNMMLLEETEDFKDLIAQIHYFNGDESYTPELLKTMENWVSKKDVNLLSQAMSVIAKRLPRHTYVGSDIDIMFSMLQKVSVEELV